MEVEVESFLESTLLESPSKKSEQTEARAERGQGNDFQKSEEKGTDIVKDATNKELTFAAYLAYRKENPGPRSRNSFQWWVRHGGQDSATFQWRKSKKDKKNKKTQNKHTHLNAKYINCNIHMH